MEPSTEHALDRAEGEGSYDEQSSSTPQRLEVLIVGSCVSRDTFMFLDPKHFSLQEYIARQSLVSGFGPVGVPLVDTTELTSRFQRRMIEGDAASDLPVRVERAAASVDLLLWDLVDERLGVHVHDDGGVTTDTVELRTVRGVAAAADAPAGTRHVRFGSDEHFSLFVAALPSWRALLARTGLLERTVLLAPPWAVVTESGGRTPASFGLTADAANAQFTRYVAAARDVVGVPVLGRGLGLGAEDEDGPVARALTTHQWGLAPFHYDDATYTFLAEGIAATALRWCRPSGWVGGRSPLRVPTPIERDPSLRYRIEPGVELTLTSPGELTVTLTAPPLKAWAFHLYRDGERVALTPWAEEPVATFPVTEPGVYRCRAHLLTTSGGRRPVVSAPLRVG